MYDDLSSSVSVFCKRYLKKLIWKSCFELCVYPNCEGKPWKLTCWRKWFRPVTTPMADFRGEAVMP